MLASAPLAGVAGVLGAAGGPDMPASFAPLDVWLSVELCKIRNPPGPQAWPVMQSRPPSAQYCFAKYYFAV
jgi:hypothetical protein